MQISSLDITLRRISQIERQFAVLDKSTNDSNSFEKALNNAMSNDSQKEINVDSVKLPEITSISSFSTKTNELRQLKTVLMKIF